MLREQLGTVITRVQTSSRNTFYFRLISILPYALVLFLLLWKTLLWLNFPDPAQDGTIVLGHTFSIIRGEFFEETFFHGFNPYQLPYMYGVISALFYSIAPFGLYNIIVFNSLLNIIILIFSFLYLNRFNSMSVLNQTFILLGIVTNAMLYDLRYEPLAIIFVIIIMHILKSHDIGFSKWIMLSVASLTALVGLIHPVGGVYVIGLVFLISLEKGFNLRNFSLYLFIVFILVLTFYGPIIIIDFNNWKSTFLGFRERDFTNTSSLILFSPTALINYLFVYAPLATFYFAYQMFFSSLKSRLREFVWFFLIVIILAIWGPSYYFTYLLTYFLWRFASFPPAKPRKWLAISVLLLAPTFTIYFPSVQQVLSDEYVATYRDILQSVGQYADKAENHVVWLERRIAMPIIDKKGTRAHYEQYLEMGHSRIKLSDGDVVLFTEQKQLDYLKNILDHPLDELTIKEIHPEVRGMIFRRSSSSLGLWEISLKQSSDAKMK